MDNETIDLTNTVILAVVAPTPDQLAEAHISAQMLEDDRQLCREPSRYERERMGVYEPVRNEDLGLGPLSIQEQCS